MKRSLTIPNDIVYKILIELPAKTLLRFKCVSKEWICIIEDSEFVNSHRIRSYSRSGGVQVLGKENYDNWENSTFRRWYIVDPEGNSKPARVALPKRYAEMPYEVEGLICIDNFVLNLSTREGIKLLHRGYPENLYYIGFDSHSKTYKALTLLRLSDKAYNRNPPRVEVELVVRTSLPGLVVRASLPGRVLTLGTTGCNFNSWRDVIIPTGLLKEEYSCLGILIHTYFSADNKIFFLVSPDNNDDNYDRIKQSLLIFGVEEEKFIGLLNELPWNMKCFIKPLEVNGRLAMYVWDNYSKEGTVWILVDYNGNGTWIKRNILFPKAKGFRFYSVVAAMNCSNNYNDTEILFKVYQDPPLSRLELYTPGFCSYIFYNLATNYIRLGKRPEYFVDLWFCKHVETMFRFKPRSVHCPVDRRRRTQPRIYKLKAHTVNIFVAHWHVPAIKEHEQQPQPAANGGDKKKKKKPKKKKRKVSHR